MTAVNIVGIDLSAPSNLRGTCVVVLRCHKDLAVFAQSLPVAGDAAILDLVSGLSGEGQVVVGLDAPLSYQPGGGLRLRDRSLRDRIVEHGMRHGSVMPPTFNRMAYLTLRGLGLARLLSTLNQEQVRVIEVHPGATFCLRGAPLASVLAFKKRLSIAHRFWSGSARRALHRFRVSNQAITLLPPLAPRLRHGSGREGALSGWHRQSHRSTRSPSRADRPGA